MYKKKHKDANKPFKWKHSAGEVILWLVRWYGRYALSYNDLKEMAAERGLAVDKTTIYRWVAVCERACGLGPLEFYNKTSMHIHFIDRDVYKLEKSYFCFV